MSELVVLDSKVIEAVLSPSNNFVTQIITVNEPIISGSQGPQGPPGPKSNASEAIDTLTRPSYTSDHPGTLTRGMAVCLVNGMLRRATSQSPFHLVAGLVFEDSILQGQSGRIQTDLNFITTVQMWDVATGMLGGLSPNQFYFLSATGEITPFAPTYPGNYVSSVGFALNSTTLRLCYTLPILL